MYYCSRLTLTCPTIRLVSCHDIYRAGAVGINLTQANHVFLMEPSFNPALEAQAIGRVHRLGQKRPVEIVRFIVNDSIESRMVSFLEKKYGKNCSSADQQGHHDLLSTMDFSSSSQVNDDHDTDTHTDTHTHTVMEKEITIGEHEDKKPCVVDTRPVAADGSLIAGNLATDRAKLMVDEFDLLFGVEDEIVKQSSPII